ncbi:hypothetical protein E2562_033829 [Oryza meyeriana var. granulata]|uniref:Uncharacterized protein n=1 Tax=Oryza meyeriana var. granulata TaxID=110450 RepID=A0A6G1F1C1_9ORYZ|nr:hypothetical protein E2562_033829 [Oryza meyeriana var. granulata]
MWLCWHRCSADTRRLTSGTGQGVNGWRVCSGCRTDTCNGAFRVTDPQLGRLLVVPLGLAITGMEKPREREDAGRPTD